MKETILVIDDQKDILESLELILNYAGYNTLCSDNGVSGLRIIDEKKVDLVLLDIRMEGMDGITCLKKIKEKIPNLPVIMISGVANIDMAIVATKKGAYDLLEKPLDKERVLLTIKNALSYSITSAQKKKLFNQIKSKYHIIGESPEILKIRDLILQVAETEARVLITGENGTGKELVAKNIHLNSYRKDNDFIEINCAAIPKELFESELFGHEKGSFTGAHQKKIGKFEYANSGTIFFDEIGDLDIYLQPKVLRALEENVITRVGGNEKIKIDARLIAATNKNLIQAIEENQFREDLYYRLNVVPIHIPPLRERKEDIPLLINFFIEEFTKREKIQGKIFTKDAYQHLTELPWPGNIRELKNTIERAMILTKAKEITKQDILAQSGPIRKKQTELNNLFNEYSYIEAKEEFEKKYLEYHLEKNNWHISNTAKKINIQRSNLYIKLEKYFPNYFSNGNSKDGRQT